MAGVCASPVRGQEQGDGSPEGWRYALTCLGCLGIGYVPIGAQDSRPLRACPHHERSDEPGASTRAVWSLPQTRLESPVMQVETHSCSAARCLSPLHARDDALALGEELAADHGEEVEPFGHEYAVGVE